MCVHVGEDDFLIGGTSKKPKAAAPVSKATTQPSADGTLSPDSDDLFKEDDLFSSGGSKKPSSSAPAKATEAKTTKQKSPATASKRPQRSNNLFGSSPEPDQDDSDDLFSSSAKPPSNKPSPQISRAKQPSAKATPPAVKKEASPKVTTKKKTTTDGLFGGSDESDDDLFSAPKPKKSAQPKPASKPSDDLFSDDPFEATTKSQTKTKSASSSKQARPPPSDDLFTDPLATSLSSSSSSQPKPQDVKSKAQKKATKPVERGRDVDGDDDLFSDPLGGGSLQPTKSKAVKPADDDLFSDDPLAPTKSLPTSRQVDTAARSKPKLKAKEAPAGDDLFSSDDPLTSSLPPATRAKPTPKATKPSSDDLFNDPLATSPPSQGKPSKSKVTALKFQYFILNCYIIFIRWEDLMPIVESGKLFFLGGWGGGGGGGGGGRGSELGWEIPGHLTCDLFSDDPLPVNMMEDPTPMGWETCIKYSAATRHS